MPALLALVLAAAPLSVRVLEKEHPRELRLEAKAVRCDALALPPSLDLAVTADGVRAGEALCREVVAEGPAQVTVGALSRTFPGALTVTRENVFLRLVNTVDVEAYLPSVVASELDAAPPAAMQAQAIVSRTFALASKRRHAQTGTDLCDLAHCQVYRGVGDAKPARDAVEATKGQVLLVGGVTLEPTYFHAACGGHTSRPADVFREKSTSPGAADLVDGAPACAQAPDFSWTWTVERSELARALGVQPDGAAFEPLRRDEGGRVLELKSFGRRLQGTELLSLVGRAFGWRTLRSLHVSASEADQSVRFSGLGTGHGVGLCQTGAKALAQKGLAADAILTRYFPQSRVRVP